MQKKNITQLWQSLELMQAGMDRQTADYVYQRDMKLVLPEPGLEQYTEPFEPVYIPRPRKDGDCFTTDLIPAWSMGRLWDFCLENGWTYDFATNLTSTEVIQKLVEGIIKKLKK